MYAARASGLLSWRVHNELATLDNCGSLRYCAVVRNDSAMVRNDSAMVRNDSATVRNDSATRRNGSATRKTKFGVQSLLCQIRSAKLALPLSIALKLVDGTHFRP